MLVSGSLLHACLHAEKLKRLAVQLWKNRYLFFKSDGKLTAKEKETMQEVLRSQPEMSFLRGFLHKVWAIFEGPAIEAEAQAKLAELKQYVAHHEKDGYTKSIAFLDDNFKNMTTFLRVPGVQRNSLASQACGCCAAWSAITMAFAQRKGGRTRSRFTKPSRIWVGASIIHQIWPLLAVRQVEHTRNLPDREQRMGEQRRLQCRYPR